MKGAVIGRQGRETIKQRIITGIIVLPLLVAFIQYSSAGWFLGFVGIVTGLALHEFLAISLPSERGAERFLGIAGGVAWLAVLCLGTGISGLGLLVFLVMGFSLAFLFRFQDLEKVIFHLGLILTAFLYLPLLLSSLVLLRQLPHGREWIFLVLLIVMIGDTAAYFVGINVGRHKLYPAISPNKSREGAVGGLVGSVAGAFLAKFWFFPVLALVDCLFLGLVLGALGQLGDLFESMLKRSFGVKDSSGLIPGHGGLLDRLDSLLFAFPPAYYYALWRFPVS